MSEETKTLIGEVKENTNSAAMTLREELLAELKTLDQFKKQNSKRFNQLRQLQDALIPFLLDQELL
jgi:hypothetical protein